MINNNCILAAKRLDKIIKILSREAIVIGYFDGVQILSKYGLGSILYLHNKTLLIYLQQSET